MCFTISIFLNVETRSLGTSAVVGVSNPRLDPLSGNVGRYGEIIGSIFLVGVVSSSAYSQANDHSDTDQDQGHRTCDTKVSCFPRSQSSL